jgi:hypothetical protein
MASLRITVLFFLLVTVVSGCDKDIAPRSASCDEFRSALKSDDKAKVKEFIDQFITESFSLTHTGGNLEKLATYISNHCDVDATVFCYACIETYPAMSEINIRFLDGATEVKKTLDLSNKHNDNGMYFLNMHN